MNECCYHCSQPVPQEDAKNVHLGLLEGGVQRYFCCIGCKAVYQFINSEGLNNYYARRVQPATRLEEFHADYKAYDTLLDEEDFIALNGEEASAKLLISEMHCSACVWLLEKVIGQLASVTDVKVNLQQRCLSVRWVNERQKLSHIMSTIQQLGYKPEPWTQSARAKQYQVEKAYLLRRLGVACLLMMQIGMLSVGLYAGEWQGMQTPIRDLLRGASALLASIAIFYCAMPFYYSAWRSIANRRVNMDVPVSLALTVAYVTSLYATVAAAENVYFDTVAMFICFLLLSRFIEACSREPDTTTGSALLPLTADRRTRDGVETVPLGQLQLSDTLCCKKGQRVVADGVLLAGSSSYFDESAFTGESVPRHRLAGDNLLAGAINTGEAVWYKVHAVGKKSSLHQVEKLIEEASASKPGFAAVIDKVSPWFVIFILLAAMFTLIAWLSIDPSKALLASMAVLVVSCPCALSLATPTALAAANTYLRKQGVLPLSGRLLEQLPEITHVIFDKTGTLTYGQMSLQKVIALDKCRSEAELLQLAASLESYSEHPLARVITKTYKGKLLPLTNHKVESGKGVDAVFQGQRYRIGSVQWCAELCAELSHDAHVWSDNRANMLLCDEKTVLAEFYVQDKLRNDSAYVIDALRNKGLHLTILSGDNQQRVEKLAHSLGVNRWLASQSPTQKLAYVKALQSNGSKVLMVGDGLNDSPVIAAANVSIAMCNASDLSRANADAVLITERLAGVLETINCAKRTRGIVRQNICWAIAYNGLAMPLAAFGFLPPWLAALGMSISSLVVVFNSQRLNRIGKLVPNGSAMPKNHLLRAATI